jgi:Myb/SANT-like DNA-binding domain
MANGELGNSNLPKPQGLIYIASTLNSHFKTPFTAKQVQSRIRNLRRDYSLVKRALSESGSSGLCHKTWLVNRNHPDFWAQMREVNLFSSFYFFVILFVY